MSQDGVAVPRQWPPVCTVCHVNCVKSFKLQRQLCNLSSSTTH